jgi:hypothetical protein
VLFTSGEYYLVTFKHGDCRLPCRQLEEAKQEMEQMMELKAALEIELIGS